MKPRERAEITRLKQGGVGERQSGSSLPVTSSWNFLPLLYLFPYVSLFLIPTTSFLKLHFHSQESLPRAVWQVVFLPPGVRKWKPRETPTQSGSPNPQGPPASRMRSRADPGSRQEGSSAEGAAAHLSTFSSWPLMSSFALSSITKDALVFNYRRPTQMSHD